MVFSQRILMWFDVLKSIRNKKKYLPNKIISSNIYSANDYKKKLGNILLK